MVIKEVGVVGCGLMGSGIAQVCAQSGYKVTVSEADDTLLEKGMSAIKSRLDREVDKGRLDMADKNKALDCLRGTTNTQDFSTCDLVIEVIVEDMDLKKKVFSELDKVCPPRTVLATNTSVLSVIDLASATSRPDKVLGLHFFNPVPTMKLVEVSRTIATDESTINTGIEFVRSLGKKAIVTQDTPGFVVDRLLAPFLFSAVRLLEAGIATRDDIDTAITLGLNHPIGPLRLLDFIGLDTVYLGAVSIYEELKEPQYAPPPLLKKMVAAGMLGRKAGKGFYEYSKPE